MDIFDAIIERRSIRSFQDKPVPKEITERIIEAACHAPSNCNVQGWRFVVIDDEKIKRLLVDHGGSVIIGSAPLGVLVCYDHRSLNTEYGDWLQSASAASQNMLLAATALGLGGCWICNLPPKRVLKNIFHIPPGYSPTAYIALGYPSKITSVVERKSKTAGIIGYNIFPVRAREERAPGFLMLKRVMCMAYFRLPLFIKQRLNRAVDKFFVKKYEN